MQESVAKAMEDSFVLKGLSEYRRSGSNRHAPFGAPDFESGASTNSATPACRTATLYQCTQPVRHQRRIRQRTGLMVLDAVPATVVAGAIVEPVCEAYQRDGKHTYRVSASRCIVIYTASMSGNHKQGNRLGMDLSFYAPSFRLKQLAWSGYGFGHTSRRRPPALLQRPRERAG